MIGGPPAPQQLLSTASEMGAHALRALHIRFDVRNYAIC